MVVAMNSGDDMCVREVGKHTSKYDRGKYTFDQEINIKQLLPILIKKLITLRELTNYFHKHPG
jgi:hypothetical protein